MKKGSLFIILIFTSINGWAQHDYRKGYIITHEMDTIYGWVDYRGDVRNAKVCSFKKNEIDQAVEYMPEDITAYRFIDSKYYVSKIIDNKGVLEGKFLEYLVNGMAKLYSYRDDNFHEHYYLERGEYFIELKEEKKEELIGGKTYIKTVKPYIGLLKAVLNVYEMSDEIEKSKLDQTSLINIAKDYHNYVCTDGSECIVYEKRKPLVQLRIGPMIGLDYTVFTVKNPKEKQYDFQSSINWICGINMNLSLPRLNEKLFLQVQLLYTKYDFSGTVKTYTTTSDAYIRGDIFQMDLAVKYEYPKGKWRPTIALGAVGTYLPNCSIEEFTNTYGVLQTEMNSYDLPMKILYGFGVTPGVHYCLNQKMVLFIQLQYKYGHKRVYGYKPAVTIQSYGLSTGVYF